MKKTQKEIILEHLKMHGHINSLVCFIKYRITDLQHSIYELRKEGYNITDEWKKSKGEYANKYKEYYLKED
jgi:hypothetical protein